MHRNWFVKRAVSFAAVTAVVAGLVGVAPAAAGAAAAAPAAPTAVHIGARIPIVVDPSAAPRTHIAAPALRAQSALSASATNANIQVAYAGFTPAAQAAFQYHVDLWKPLISSSVPIKVSASWAALGSGVLGQAGPDAIVRDQPGLVAHTWYPVALANAISGSDLDPSNPDIDAAFSSNFPSWYFGTDGNPGPGQVDFVSVVLHELGHGLGFYGMADVAGGVGTWQQSGYPGIFDRFTKVSGTPVINYTNGSTALAAALQGTSVRFNGPHTNAANAGSGARLYAPPTWQERSSYSHLDESVFPAGNPNSLMTPMIGPQESIHDPGPVTLGIFADMGWPAPAVPVPPAAPTAVGTSPLDGAAQVSFTPAAGTPAGTTYTVTSSPPGATASGSSSPVTVSGLTNGDPYTFTVTATSAAGTSPSSAASNSVTPLAPPSDVPTIMAPTDGASASDLVAVTASSPDAAVRFALDGTWLGNPVAVDGGMASTTWQSHGQANGPHTIEAHSCSSLGAWSCATAAASVGVNVANTTPVLTAPTPNRVASGTLAMSADRGAGAVAFLVNGVRKAFDITAPYTGSVSVSNLADGTYTATAQSCDTDGTCSSFGSAPVSFRVKNLHPTIGSVTSSPFSPNGDGVRDSVTIGYSLPDTETVSWRVVGPSGTIKDTATLGTFAKGAHSFVWNGKDTGGHAVADGTYAIVLSTSATVSGRKLVGRATKNVIVDLTAPKITVTTGGATTIFPSGGGTPSSLAANVTLSEPGAVTLTVRNAGGTLVRTVIAAGHAGTNTVTWNGTNTTGALVTSGTYTWRLKVADVAGNVRNAGPYTTNVLRLASRTTTLVLNGNQRTQAVGCGYYYTTASAFSGGLWIVDDSAQSGGVTTAEGDYQFTVPAAYSYSSVTITTSAYSHGGTTRMFGALRTVIGPSPHVIMSPTAPAVSNLGTFTDGIVNASHQVIVGVGVDNSLRSPSDLDIGWVAITLHYTVKL